jgi:16S rRNA (adenine1518-N6/adenine1519-N6)-dimethyltransferase
MSISNNIDALAPLRDVVAAHGLTANKVFGQNYLFDLNLTRRIARYAKPVDTVIEIGPGPGGLTRALLLETSAKIIAIEKDRRFIQALQPLVDASEGRLQLIEGDALKTDLLQLCNKPRSIVANLPYNIGTELLINWLHQATEFTEMILMFQDEVTQRLIGKPNTKSYGRLSVLAQSLCHVDRLFKVPAAAFTPPPKVTSSIARLVPFAHANTAPINQLEILTGAAFGQRRKMLRQSMKEYLPLLEQCNIDPTKRAEDLSVADYIQLASQSSSGV